MAKAISGGALSRRQAIAAGSVAAIIPTTVTPTTVTPTTVIAKTVDPHPAWLSEWRECRDIFNAADDGRYDVWLRMSDLSRSISSTKPTSVEGTSAQLRFLVEEGISYDCTIDADSAGRIIDFAIAFIGAPT